MTGAAGAGPAGGNPLQTRADVQRAARECWEPLVRYTSSGGARVRLGGFAASFPSRAAELEGFARPLWAPAALAAGGGRFSHWELIRRGLAAGSDPAHPEFWGRIRSNDQRMVEMASIAAGLVLAPAELWDPLPEDVKERLAAWLGSIDDHECRHNNWSFFPVLVDLALRRVGRRDAVSAAAMQSLAQIDACYVGEGWYEDGAGGACDWYGAYVFHTYGLLYAGSDAGDPERSALFRERAAAFATQLVHWFAPDGSALPYGRSLTYRFAQASFWGALAYADLEAFDWPALKGLYLRSLRHWFALPIWDRDGILGVGYAYDSRLVAETYTSPGSSYLAFTAFLPLAAPADHPFWASAEAPQPPAGRPVVQLQPGLVLTRDAEQVVAVSAGQAPPRHVLAGAAKYARFAYSSFCGPCVETSWLDGEVSDSTLVLIDEHGVRRAHGGPLSFAAVGDLLVSQWRPWPDVEIETTLWCRAPWHARRHRIVTKRRLDVEESGFGLGYQPDDDGPGLEAEEGPGSAVVTSSFGRSGIVDLAGRRDGQLTRAAPNASTTWPRAAVPVLRARLARGEHELCCLVFAAGSRGAAAWHDRPVVPERLHPGAGRRLRARWSWRPTGSRRRGS